MYEKNNFLYGATAPFPPAQEPAAEGSADDLPF